MLVAVLHNDKNVRHLYQKYYSKMLGGWGVRGGGVGGGGVTSYIWHSTDVGAE